MALTKSQINRLGERIRHGEESDDDIALLEQVRQSYIASGDDIFPGIVAAVRYPASRRPGKTTKSIRAKLQRQGTRLSKMQDIDGCRITVPNRQVQDETMRSIVEVFPSAEVQDFRRESHHGYRAVHVIIENEHPFEVQIRTEVQNRWAQLSEALAGRFGNDLKYGGGSPTLRKAMEALSAALLSWDEWKADVDSLPDEASEEQRRDIAERWDVIDRQLAATLADIEKEVNDLAALADSGSPSGE